MDLVINVLYVGIAIIVTVVCRESVKATEFEKSFSSCLYKYYTNVTNATREYAQSTCEAWNGTLAIPESQAIMNHLNNRESFAIATGNAHIGGKRATDGEFYWATGVAVNSTAYKGWNVNWPIKAKDCCMGIRNQILDSKIFWITLQTANNFVCQKNYCTTNREKHLINATQCTKGCVCKDEYYGKKCEFAKPRVVSCTTNSTFSITFPVKITCIITGYPVNKDTTIQWKRNGKILTNNTDDAVFYQNKVSNSENIATLILKREICIGNIHVNPIIKHPYNGITFINSSKIINLPKNYSTELLYDLTAESSKCGGTRVHVKWKSNAPSHLMLFRVETFPSSRIANTDSTEYEFTQLLPNQTYQIYISIASKKLCKGQENVTLSGEFTSGIVQPPARFSNLSAENVESFKCKVSWNYEQWKNVETFTISITGETYKTKNEVTFPQYKASYDIYNISDAMTWGISLPPNKIYNFSVQARNCAGNSSPVLAQSSCITSTDVPKTIPIPALSISSNGDKIISLPSVDEMNGPVSCILLVVTKHRLQNGNTLLTNDQFAEMTNINGYITYCIENFPDTTNVTLGDNMKTSCITGESARKRRATSSTFTGNNNPLDEKAYCCIYSIAVVISDDILVYRRTNKSVSISKFESTNSNLILILVSSVCGVFLMLIIIVVCVFRKKAQKNGTLLGTQVEARQDESNKLEKVNVLYGITGENSEQDGEDQSETTKTERVNELYGSTAFDEDHEDECVTEATYATVKKE